MSNSIQSQALDAVVAVLGGAAANAFRCRMSAFTAEQLPADNVIPEDETNDPAESTTDGFYVRHRFVVRHEGQAVDEVDKAIDARYVRGQQLILADPTLGGLVVYTRYVSRKWERESKGQYDSVALAVTYEIEFCTSRSDPSVASF